MTDTFRAMCAELTERMEWFIAEDETNENDPGNQYWLTGKQAGIDSVTRARALLAQPVAQSLPANYIDPEHTGQDREVLDIFYTACQSEGGTTDEIHLRGIRAVLAARALLAQPVAEGPTVMEIIELHTWLEDEWRANNDGEDLPTLDFARAVLARWGRPTPQPVWADIHYAWELHDADGEWQAGGSANSLEDVQREGNRYLQTYSQDGPHKLIIQRHCVSTIEEAQQ